MSNQEAASTIHWWQRKESIIAFAIIGTLVFIAVLIFAAHAYHWDTTAATTTEVIRSPQQKVTTTETGKTLLDWLQLLGVLAIPIVVGFGTAFFTKQQAKTSEANAENQQQDELLRTYFDKISDLLLDKELRANPDKELRANPDTQFIVRARTLAALHMLNTERKAIVLRFLHDSNFLQYVRDFLYSLDLSHADLSRINLSGANLYKANLREAILSEANLDIANLSGAVIHPEKLKEANNVTQEQLAQSKQPPPRYKPITSAQLAAANKKQKGRRLSTPPTQSERKPQQTSQEEAEQKEHKQPKQDTDAAY
jgi:uncharacterized protein YjbI with pentapeptide repeats